MTLRTRKLVVVAVIATVLLLVNVNMLVGWIAATGLIDAAIHIRGGYLTGTGITVIAVIVFLATPDRCGRPRRYRADQCPVCGEPHASCANYCGACGSRLRTTIGPHVHG